MKKGLFIGLITLDLIYLVDQVPEGNQKIVAKEYVVAAGGPATNAAVAFNYLENYLENRDLRAFSHETAQTYATVLASLGLHPMSQLMLADLQQYGVAIADLAPVSAHVPPVSSILITESTGDRAVISLNAARTQANVAQIPDNILQNVDVVLLDGHQIAVSEAIAKQAKANQIPVVVDAGSWKPGLDRVLPSADYVVCSANFYPPGCNTSAAVFSYLKQLGISQSAITHGAQPIQHLNDGDVTEISVPQIRPVDTVGAGDIFHGAFCHYILQTSFSEALARSAEVAARSCQFFGTRRWMDYSNRRVS